MSELFKSLKWQHWLILVVSASLFLPYVISTGVLLVACLISLFKKECVSSLRLLPGKWFILPLLLLELVVSAYYQNIQGILIAINFLGLFIYLAFYHKHINDEVFKIVVDMMIILMVVIGIYSLFQFNEVSKMGGYTFTDFVIQNSPKRRITGVFQNANIFAMMIELVLAMILYRFLQTKKMGLKVYYVIVGLFLFVIMCLTGCRAALIPLVFVIPILLKQANAKKLLLLYGVVFVCIFVLVFIKPTIIPRINDISTISSRFKIWKTALKGIEMRPLLGQGPWTYQLIYPIFKGHKAVHAHNIYLDSLLSFGIVGSSLLSLFVISLFRRMAKMKENSLLFGLMISFVLIIGVHGLVDGTIHPVTVMMVVFMILYNQPNLKRTIQSDTL